MYIYIHECIHTYTRMHVCIYVYIHVFINGCYLMCCSSSSASFSRASIKRKESSAGS